MDVENQKFKLHPRAQDFLFENFANLRRIFSDVIGQLEVSYLSIALINKNKEIFFLSSNPSIEQNLIDKNLWQYNWVIRENFIYQNDPKLWNELSHFDYPEVRLYKQQTQRIVEGISIPIDYGNYRAILSFGFKEMNSYLSLTYHAKLVAMGRYCLNRINSIILFPDKQFDKTKPHLTLIINNLGKL